MDFRKALIIARKDIRILYSDRNLMLILFAAPLALTLIIGAAFSGFGNSGSDTPISHIPVAVVNMDTGANIFTQKLNYGDIITQIIVPAPGMTPDPANTLQTLFDAKQMSSEADARALVDQGKLTAAILIPANFSQSLNPVNAKIAPTTITVYRDAGASTTAGIVSIVIHSLVNTVVGSDIAIFTAKDVVTAGKASPALLSQLANVYTAADKQFREAVPIKLINQTVGIVKTSQPVSNNPLSYFAPAVAIFFVTFTAAGGATSLIDEKNTWTLQRMLTSPTSRATVLVGKLGGTYLNGLIQLTLLIIFTTLIGPILGDTGSVWGTNFVGLIVVMLASVAAATGLGMLIAGVARSAQQADVFGNALLIIMGLLGGAFFDITTLGGPFSFLSRLTLNYWGTSSFKTLAQGGDLRSVLPGIGVLLLMFVVFFSIGLALFSRRQDV
jgi:ABC-2 type transport system permease protein